MCWGGRANRIHPYGAQRDTKPHAHANGAFAPALVENDTPANVNVLVAPADWDRVAAIAGRDGISIHKVLRRSIRHAPGDERG